MLKTPNVRATFGGSDVLSRGSRKGLCTFSKVSKTWGFCSISKNDGRRGTFEEDLERCIFRGRHSTRDMFIRAVRRSGHWFPERGCILEPQIFRFAGMILRDRCSTSYDLALEETRSHTLEMVQIFILSFFCRFYCHLFCHFSFVCHFVCHFLSFFCHFSFVCHFVCHFLSFFCHFSFVCHFFCHFSKNFSIFFTIFDKFAPKRQKNDKFSTKKRQKMALLQVAKIAFFSKHCHFFVIFLSFFDFFFDLFHFF